jgi:hypothetical protein
MFVGMASLIMAPLLAVATLVFQAVLGGHVPTLNLGVLGLGMGPGIVG